MSRKKQPVQAATQEPMVNLNLNLNLERRAEAGRKKRAKTRVMLIESAIAVVSQRGFEHPSIDDFINAAGVARGTFYNYFDTKSDLLKAMASHVVDSVDARILPLFQCIENPAQRIAIAIRMFIQISQEDPDRGWILVRALPDVRGGWSDDMRQGVISDLQQGVNLGLFDIPSLQAALALSIGALGGVIQHVLSEPVESDYAVCVASMLLQSLGMSAEQAREIARLPLPDGRALPE